MKSLYLAALLSVFLCSYSYANSETSHEMTQTTESQLNDTAENNAPVSLKGVTRGRCYSNSNCSNSSKISSSNTCGHCLHNGGKCWIGGGSKVKKQTNCPKK